MIRGVAAAPPQYASRGCTAPKAEALTRSPAQHTEMRRVVVVGAPIPKGELVACEQNQIPCKKATGAEVDVANNVSHVEGRKLPVDDERVERAGLGVEEHGVWSNEVPDGADIVLWGVEKREIKFDGRWGRYIWAMRFQICVCG